MRYRTDHGPALQGGRAHPRPSLDAGAASSPKMAFLLEVLPAYSCSSSSMAPRRRKPFSLDAGLHTGLSSAWHWRAKLCVHNVFCPDDQSSYVTRSYTICV